MRKYLYTITVATCMVLCACQGTAAEVSPTSEPQQSPATDTPMAIEPATLEPSYIVFSSTRGTSGMFDLFLLDPGSLEITPLNIGAGAPRILP